MLDHIQVDRMASKNEDPHWNDLNDLERRLIKLIRSMSERDRQKISRVTEVMVMSYGWNDHK
ncbi:hypothetical protein EXW72_03175 [Pseudomonas sp. BCA14]|uniref:hypothetical protein n=1 Tax=unclassified Pseudomonas TaxID=196821 RepID=UPI00106E0153|nr:MULTISPECIES: hypothetical protein [unclassified Pseudomonas]TFF13048.1 hypothetical protein EXW70_00515 [Pseudomonas sp. JMN1]TFF16269.1 hypothetical protein EXW71_08525 [Pseudomonas sp. BCA17]TFF30206.1 hypothetical protein EXW73_07760 [Pseudomonas sp. BCA13]TFF31047.1 hypothetical protein EXW72_03175 [Pseudomonas sp. BCA14]